MRAMRTKRLSIRQLIILIETIVIRLLEILIGFSSQSTRQHVAEKCECMLRNYSSKNNDLSLPLKWALKQQQDAFAFY